MFTSVTFRTLGANVTACVVGFASRTEVIGDLVQRTGTLLTIVRSAVHGVPVETGSALVTLRPGRIVLAYLRRIKEFLQFLFFQLTLIVCPRDDRTVLKHNTMNNRVFVPNNDWLSGHILASGCGSCIFCKLYSWKTDRSVSRSRNRSFRKTVLCIPEDTSSFLSR